MKHPEPRKAVGHGQLALRAPTAADGLAVHTLIARCPPLDQNSMYCNLLQCTHWSSTCVVAERDDRIIGFISGYVLPERPDTLFIWQVAVAEEARGLGLASRMLDALLERDICADVARLETTITRDNAASWVLFHRFADRRDARLDASTMFDEQTHFGGGHATEVLVRIGPFVPAGQHQTKNERRSA